MAKSGSMISGVAERYAGSLFELARDAKSVPAVEKDLADFEAMLNGSADLRKVVARNRRLFAVPQMIRAFREIAARERGEVTAEVRSAHALTSVQENELKAALKGVTGKDVSVAVSVDPSLLGGMVVKIGSRQIDTSLKTKLDSLKLALKEVG